MSDRVQVILSNEERQAFRREAEKEGLSLSAWLRDAGRRRLAESRTPSIQTREDLRAFFKALPDRSSEDPEPDWEQHLEVIDASRRRDRPSA